jgi:hypothetical protein
MIRSVVSEECLAGRVARENSDLVQQGQDGLQENLVERHHVNALDMIASARTRYTIETWFRPRCFPEHQTVPLAV